MEGARQWRPLEGQQWNTLSGGGRGPLSHGVLGSCLWEVNHFKKSLTGRSNVCFYVYQRTSLDSSVIGLFYWIKFLKAQEYGGEKRARTGIVRGKIMDFQSSTGLKTGWVIHLSSTLLLTPHVPTSLAFSQFLHPPNSQTWDLHLWVLLESSPLSFFSWLILASSSNLYLHVILQGPSLLPSHCSCLLPNGWNEVVIIRVWAAILDNAVEVKAADGRTARQKESGSLKCS